MRDELLTKYEAELGFLRQMGVEFKQRYPKVGERLALEPNKCEDPHVERLLEAFAFLAARIHLRLDDDLPEITEALLNILYPHYLRPIPSMSVAELQVDPDQVKPDSGLTVPRNAMLRGPQLEGVRPAFKTCYDVTFWPFEIAGGEWNGAPEGRFGPQAAGAIAAINIRLRCHGELTFSKLGLSSARLYLNGRAGLIHDLYEVIANSCTRVLLRDLSRPGSAAVVLEPQCIRPTGFDEQDAMLPYTRRSFSGYRLLQEYFCFPEKFLFIDLAVFDAIRRAGFGSEVEVSLLISRFERDDRRHALELGVSGDTFRLNCTPIVNLFSQSCDAAIIDHARYEYPVTPDAGAREAVRVFSVDEVVSTNPQKQETVRFEPFYSYRHGSAAEHNQTFWYASRRDLGNRVPNGPEMYVVLVDLSGRPMVPDVDVLNIRATCMNGDLPHVLNAGADFQFEGAAPVKKVTILLRPTASMEPPAARDSAWRLVSQLSLNYLSIVQEGRDALQAILRLYNFNNKPESDRQIEGILDVRTKPQFARMLGEQIVFARGLEVRMTFDDANYAGAGVFLFASVLERFLGTYVSMNSFCQLVARTKAGKSELRRWPPRSGQRTLL